MKKVTVWGIHAGKLGDASTLFKSKSCVALGWKEMPDLSTLKKSRESFKKEVTDTYPKKKPGAIPNNAGQLYRFVHEMKVDDLVVFPDKSTRKIYVGRVASDYSYAKSSEPAYPHRRKVEWIGCYERTQFSQGALYEIGSAMSFFMVKSHANEFKAAANGEPIVSEELDEDSAAVVAAQSEETTRDFVIKRLSKELKGLPLEDFIKHLLECMGYQARLTRVNEPSVDIIAHKDQLGIEPPIIKVQVKSGEGTISDKDVSALYGKLSHGEYGLFVTLGTFSKHCHDFEQGKGNLRLIDGNELVNLIFQHYESFDSRFKGVIPLKRVYVPELIKDEE